MNRDEIESGIESLQDTLSNIKIMLAVPMSVIMCLYFFTYGSLIDMNYHGILYFEIGTSIAFFLILFNLNSVGYRLVKMRLAGKSQYQPLFAQLSAKTINTPLQTLTDQVSEKLLSKAR